MIYIHKLPYQLVTLLLVFLFLAALSEFVLILLYKVSHIRRSWHIILSCGVLALLFMLICLCEYSSIQYYILVITIILILALIHISIEIVYCIKHYKNNLSPYSIKETVDNLPSGLCFSDADGMVILCNRQMGKLSSALIGSYPQTTFEIENALKNLSEESSVKCISEELSLYQFPDKKIWRFCQTNLTDGFRQFMAQDVTELHNANEKLESENEELKKVNEKLCEMYERLAGHIREQELLSLKMRIHDNMGASLIAISDIMNYESNGDMDKQLSILQDAVSYLSNDRPFAKETFDELQKKAEEMKVNLLLNGNIPKSITVEKLVVSAIKECITNCVNHAGGNCVIVEITDNENSGFYHITITNNGKPPRGKIIEGGGLSNLRKRIELAGGEMNIFNNQSFILSINLPSREYEL